VTVSEYGVEVSEYGVDGPRGGRRDGRGAMLDSDRAPDRRRAAARLRQARCRARRRRGETAYQVAVPDAVVEALLVTGRLTDGESLRRPLVEAALAGVLAEWANRWL
jgi:hypothetical protein